ncbi:MFS transporter [Streptomyces sp. MB09-02B]|uniref:MFS transporter n=1 Tax=Streptomyces sp. MB09-02B TaxID=3028667 RepID=UPI0029B219C9|nr:MFS transporter [Streptomyces sp. MB09-02B]MDX3639990.1 MFS transporter [Streptomyces sp. MB09-02B]
MSTVAPPRAGRREWTGLAALALPTLLISMDMTVLYLAMPQLSVDLGPTSTEMLWITDIYGFLIAGALVPMGALGDRVGRRRLLLTGAALFAAASVLAAYSTSAPMLIGARALLGLAGATLMPSTLSLVRVMFEDTRQRGFAVAVVMTSFSVGTTIGPVLGGVLLTHFWWGSVFLLGVPVMVLLLALGPTLLPEYRDPAAGRLDLASAVLSLAAVLSVVYAVKQLAEHGVGWVPAVSASVGVAVGTAFVRRQRRLTDPLLDLGLLGDRVVNASLGIYLLGLLAMGGTQLFIALYLQEVLGLSPMLAGAWMVPAALGTIVGSLLAPLLVRRLRPFAVVSGSLLLAGVGFGTMTRLGSDDLPLLMVGYVIVALGLSPMIALCTDLVISTAPPQRAGAASALSETSGELGVALGVAVLGSFGMAVYRDRLSDTAPDGLPPEAADTATNTVAGAVRISGELPGRLGEALADAAREAFAHGLALASVAATLIVITAAVLSAVRLRDLPASAASASAATAVHPDRDRAPSSGPDAEGRASSAQPACVLGDGEQGHRSDRRKQS